MNLNKLNKRNCSALILAAGKSSRFGRDKAFIKFDKNQTFISHIVEGYINFGCQEVVVVANENNADKIKNHLLNSPSKIIINTNPDRGRFSSIQTGCNALTNPEYLFISNVDNPFIDNNLLYALLSNINYKDAIFPTYRSKGGHPVMISQKIISQIILSETNDINFRYFLDKFDLASVEVESTGVLVNVNLEGEWAG